MLLRKRIHVQHIALRTAAVSSQQRLSLAQTLSLYFIPAIGITPAFLLGFMYGAELPDPEGLLEGEGKLFRHVRIAQPQQLSNPGLRKLVQVASVHRMPTKPSSSNRKESI
jgi:hypothetical protein